jgi:hypothetical protein
VSGVRTTRIRLLAAVTGALGATLVLRPEAVAKASSGPDAVPRAWIVRALGGRMLLQAAVQAARPDPRVVDAGVAVDASHGASMVALAAVSPRYRRPASLSAAVAGLSTALGLACRTGRR